MFHQPTIDPEFKELCPSLTSEELNQLRTNIEENGCRDPLCVWGPEKTLLDGHHRLEICHNLSIPFETIEIELPDRGTAINWIINNQLGRRNLTPEQASYLRGKRYNRESRPIGAPPDNKNATKQRPQNEDIIPRRTSERLAEEYNVSKATIERDGKFAQAIDNIEASTNIGTEIKQAVLSGESGLKKQEVLALGNEASVSINNPQETETPSPMVKGVELNEYAIQTENGDILFKRDKIADLIAETKKNPGPVAEWSRLIHKISQFRATYDTDELITTLIESEKDFTGAYRCLEYFEIIVAKIESKIGGLQNTNNEKE